MKRVRVPVLVGVVATLLLWGAIAWRAPGVRPLRRATTAEFWRATTGIDLSGGPSESRHTFAVSDGDEFLFALPEDGDRLGIIREQETLRDFPSVQAVLAHRVGLNGRENYLADGYARWLAVSPTQPSNVRWFLECLDAARIRTWDGVAEIKGELVGEYQVKLERAGRAARVYWATVTFELVYFAGLVWWCCWPWVKGRGFVRKIVHLGAVPLVVALPMWFGYCNPGYPWWECGGVLYDCLWRLPQPMANYSWEEELLARLPPVLEPVTQGSPLSFAEYKNLKTSPPVFMGPVNVAVEGAALAAVYGGVCGIAVLLRKWRRRVLERPGFPVEVAGEVVSEGRGAG